MAATFAGVEPFRPYLIGLTILTLGYAWYRQVIKQPEADCACDTTRKTNYRQAYFFLGLVTVFAFAMLAFPSYANVFYPEKQKQQMVQDKGNIQTAEFKISGMSCGSCAPHVNREINKLTGIVKAETSYEKANTIVAFDKTKTSVQQIQQAIGQTGYKVTATKVKP